MCLRVCVSGRWATCLTTRAPSSSVFSCPSGPLPSWSTGRERWPRWLITGTAWTSMKKRSHSPASPCCSCTAYSYSHKRYASLACRDLHQMFFVEVDPTVVYINIRSDKGFLSKAMISTCRSPGLPSLLSERLSPRSVHGRSSQQWPRLWSETR